MPTAEIIAIGTELLLGEIQDTNTRYLARVLRDHGIDLYRATMIGDNPVRIADSILEAMGRADIIITTGGLGPTVDDPTREAVAAALGTSTEFRQDLWDQIQERFRRFGRNATENNRRQAYVPRGSIAVTNEVGTAPAFICESRSNVIISLPGVPREMEYLIQNQILPYLRQRFRLGVIKVCVVHTSGLGESVIDDQVSDLETLSNPTVGLSAHTGQVDVRVTAKAADEQQADQLIGPVVEKIIARLGDAVFGIDADTLEDAVAEELIQKGWKVALLECGIEGKVHRRLTNHPRADTFIADIQVETLPCPVDQLLSLENEFKLSRSADVFLIASLHSEGEKQVLNLLIHSPAGRRQEVKTFGGPPANASLWASNMILDYLRRSIG